MWTEGDYVTAEKAFWADTSKHTDGIRAALDAVAHRLSEPRFPAVTDEQAKAIYVRYCELGSDRCTTYEEDIRDAINEVMGGQESATEAEHVLIHEARERASELRAELADRDARIAELEGDLQLSREATQAAVDSWNEEAELRKRVQTSETAADLLTVAQATISLNATVWATSKADALRKARDLAMPTIHESSSYVEFDPDEQGVSDEAWKTSGELDGVPCDIAAERGGK